MDSRQRIRRLIFAHLAAAAVLPACGDSSTPATSPNGSGAPDPALATATPIDGSTTGSPDATAAGTTTAPETPTTVVIPDATAAPSTTVAPTTTSAPTNTPAPSSTATTTGGSKALGATCNNNNECQSGHCRLGFTGAEFIRPGTCVKNPPIYRGRPLTVAGEQHVATIIDGEARETARGPELSADVRRQWSQLLEEWTAEEHASIAAFSRTICELMALGAPLDLIAETQRALADEIRHTDACLSWLSTLRGTPATLGSLAAAVAPFDDVGDRAASLLDEVVRGGCIGETRAAHEALELASTAPLPELTAHFQRTASDESRHAALAFRTARWLVAAHPRLGARFTELEGELMSSLGAEDHAMLAPLMRMVHPQAA